MTNPDFAAVMLLIDRSGSMASIQRAAEGGVNDFIKGQAAQPGRRTIRIAKFDDAYELVQPSTSAATSPSFKLEPRGMTALLDAMGRSINEFGQELAALPEDERPGVVILAVMTDGHENASVEYDWPMVRAMVEHQEKAYGWQVLYLGANQDAVETGVKLGVQRSRSMTYAATDHGTRSVTDSLSGYVASAASGLSASFTDEDREDAQR